MLFYDVNYSHFDDRVLNILRRHHIQSFTLKTGDSVHGQTNDNGPNTKLKNFYDKKRRNWMRHHGKLKVTPPHMNYVLVETWEAFKLSSTTTT